MFAASSGPEEPGLSITKLKANRRLRPHTIILNDDVLVRIDPCSSCYLRCLDWHIELFADALRPEVSEIDKIPAPTSTPCTLIKTSLHPTYCA